MENKVVDCFSRISPLSKEESDAIAQSMQTKSLKKGDYLLREGQISTRTYFILEGCVREYILTDGEEKSTNFFTEEQWAISLNSFAPRNAATHNWVCVEDRWLSKVTSSKARHYSSVFLDLKRSPEP
jgi:signal-transduction protein with cAMP-binding, CBS, and nucleotidyltransferase domain